MPIMRPRSLASALPAPWQDALQEARSPSRVAKASDLGGDVSLSPVADDSDLGGDVSLSPVADDSDLGGDASGEVERAGKREFEADSAQLEVGRQAYQRPSIGENQRPFRFAMRCKDRSKRAISLGPLRGLVGDVEAKDVGTADAQAVWFILGLRFTGVPGVTRITRLPDW